MTAAAPAVLLVDGLEGLEAVRPAWSALADRCPWATPFQRPEWLLPWARAFPPAGLWCVALAAPGGSGRLRGLAVLAVSEDEAGRRVGLAGEGLSDHLDVLAEPGAEDELTAAVLDLLAERRAAWSGVRLNELSPESPWLRVALPPPWRARREPASACPALALPADGDLRDAIPPSAWKRLAYDRRRAAREGELTATAAADPAAAAEALETLFALHEARWREAGEPGVLDHPAVRRFHREVAAGFAAAGRLALHVLRLDGEPLAVVYGFRERGTLCYYLGGFDPARASLSPGWLAVGHAIERAAADGCRTFDFLRGEEPYKARWGARPRRNAALVLELVGR